MRFRISMVVAMVGILHSGMGIPSALSEEDAGSPGFSRKPTATRAGEKVEIEFTVDRETDVAVFVEDREGRVVRHLVAGVLGKNPPPLLQPGLAQSIEWDGLADYGKPAGSGPFRVRVALGMKVAFDKVVIEDQNALNQVKGLAVGPDGTVYVLNAPGGAVWKGEQILAFDRDGNYRRSVLPFPTTLPMEKVRELGAFEVRGRPAPLVQHVTLQLAPGPKSPRKTGMALTPDGKVLLRLAGEKGGQHMSALGVDGSAAWSDPVGPALLSETIPPSDDGKFRGGWNQQPALAVSSDGKWAFVAGFAFAKTPYAAVFRVPLPDRARAERFFGSIEKAGKGNDLLAGQPGGLACDGQGHLLICDTGNDRVVIVKEADGSFVGEFACERPRLIAVHPKTGAVYVARSGAFAELIKYSSWKEPRELATVRTRVDGNGTFVMGLDANAPDPIVWIGTDKGKLLRVADSDGRLDLQTVSSSEETNGSFMDMSVDRFRPDREIYSRNNLGWWYRHNEKTGETDQVDLRAKARLSAGGGGGKQLLSGPDGNLYGLGYPYHMFKLDRDGQPLGFDEGGYPERTPGKFGRMDDDIRGLKFGRYVPVSMTDMTHTLGIRGDGRVFAFEPARHGDRPPKALHEYLPNGKRVTTDPIVWMVSDGAVGPRFDAEDNIYVAETVNPGGQPYPEPFEALLGSVEMNKTRPTGVQDQIANMYGSIVKFSPKGGTFHFEESRWLHEDYKPYRGEPKLDPSLKTIDAGFYSGRIQRPLKITGAEWLAFGYSHVEVRSCVCETTRFDVDEFGRVFYPDLGLYQVRVVDTAGNPILEFGGYGTADNRGSESADQALAEPEIAFAWLVGVVATDKYVYTGDSINRRMLRCRLDYAAEATSVIE